MGNFALSSYWRVTACRTRTERVGLVIMGRSEPYTYRARNGRWSSDYGRVACSLTWLEMRVGPVVWG